MDCVHRLKGEVLLKTCVSAKISSTLIKKIISVSCPLPGPSVEIDLKSKKLVFYLVCC